MTSCAISPKVLAARWNFFTAIVFLFFLTLSTEAIKIDLGYFQLKAGHVLGFLLLLLSISSKRFAFVGKQFYYCAVFALSSIIISSFFSDLFLRSFTYIIIYIFSFFAYFIVPVNIMYFQDEAKVIKLYLISFFCIGSYAALQFFSSIFGVILPFSVQTVVFVRGSAFAHEPSFYALYAIPFVAFLNAKWLLKVGDGKRMPVLSLVFANLFLLVSTATTAFFSYVVFFFVLFFFNRSEYKKKNVEAPASICRFF